MNRNLWTLSGDLRSVNVGPPAYNRKYVRGYASLDSAALVAVVESTHRQESAMVAPRMAAAAALLRQRVAAAEPAEHRREIPS